MKRSTWLTLVVFAALLLLWWLQARPVRPDTPPPLQVDGYLGQVTADEARALAAKQASPVDHITLRRPDGHGGTETLELARDPSPAATSPADTAAATWTLHWRQQGTAVTWPAQGYRAQQIAELLQRSVRSSYAVQFAGNAAAEYQLDAAHAIEFSLSASGKSLASLKIGLLTKSDRDGEPTTWVADPARPGVAYQIVGRDLRTAVAVPLADLRDRHLLAGRTQEALRAFTITRDGTSLQARRAGEAWQTDQPGVDAAKLADYARQAVGIQADWLPELPTAAQIEPPAWSFAFQFADANVQIDLGPEDAGAVHGRIAATNRAPEYFKLSSWSAKSLQKQAVDFAPSPTPTTAAP